MDLIKNGAAHIQNLIDSAKAEGTNCVTVTGNYEMEKTVLIPSDFCLVLENCYLCMAEGTFCNMFTNESCRKNNNITDKNIIIEGRGRVVLDGGKYNGLSEKNSLKDDNPHICVNNVILFTNVDGFCIKNIHIRNQRWWAMNFIFCCNGKISDIDFLADYTRIDENGNRVEGLTKDDYPGTHIKNADGIDLRCGCHDIIIENITGFCEDDSVALTGLDGDMENFFAPQNAVKDIYNVIIRNIMTSSFCSNVRLLNQGGIKLYNVLVDGVFDTSKDSRYMDKGWFGVRIGDTHLYGERHSTEDETFNITVKNVYSRGEAALYLAGAMKNCHFENINIFEDGEQLVINRSTSDTEKFFK